MGEYQSHNPNEEETKMQKSDTNGSQTEAERLADQYRRQQFANKMEADKAGIIARSGFEKVTDPSGAVGFRRKRSQEDERQLQKLRAQMELPNNILDKFDSERLHLEHFEGEPLDYNNEEVLEKVLIFGTDEDKEKLRQSFGYSSEQLQMYSQFAELRHKTVESDEEAGKTRRAENPKATAEEMDMGAYLEYIEPQVRDAVFALRKKGYSTFESGFDGVRGDQIISFEDNHLEGYELPKELVQTLAEKGVTVTCDANSIKIHFDHFADLEETKQVWNLIIDALPDLGHPAKPSTTAGAEMFRKRQEEITK